MVTRLAAATATIPRRINVDFIFFLFALPRIYGSSFLVGAAGRNVAFFAFPEEELVANMT
jgi:hypothetical protein